MLKKSKHVSLKNTFCSIFSFSFAVLHPDLRRPDRPVQLCPRLPPLCVLGKAGVRLRPLREAELFSEREEGP